MKRNKKHPLIPILFAAFCALAITYAFMTMMMNAFVSNLKAATISAPVVNYEIIELAPEVPVEPVIEPVVEPVIEPVIEEVPAEVLTVVTDAEFELICRVVMSEARGESYEGQQAVAQVIRDRMEHPNTKTYGGPTAEGVVLKKSQFAKPYKGEISEGVREAVASVFYEGERVFEEPALYFFHTKLANSGAVNVMRTYKYVDTIGVHEFRGNK